MEPQFDKPNEVLLMASQFHASARSELVQRVVLRDTMLFLYLAGTASLFSVSVNASFRVILYFVPLLGLGATYTFCQHNTVIGALGRYLGVELHDWLRKQLPEANVPAQWDCSKSLLYMKGHGYIRPVLFAGLTLLVLPQVAAVAVAAATTKATGLTVVAFNVGVLCVLASIVALLSAYRTRNQYAQERKLRSQQ
jgi:hypothetical protein